MRLDQEFVARTKRRIEQAIVPAMEESYLGGWERFIQTHRPEFKEIEKIVSYYDYRATGISVLAPLAVAGDERAQILIQKLREVMDHYRREIFNHEIGGNLWTVPLRRLLLHIALAYEKLEPVLSAADKAWYRGLVDEQAPLAIEHCHDFFPGEKDLHLTTANNHDAIFMQGIYYCGKVFGRPEWVDLTREFAERFYASGHPDGYWEEHTNAAREGGPSLCYTTLTSGSLYDVLDGRNRPREKFLNAGRFYRSLLSYDYGPIPIADERTNQTRRPPGYGLALHSLTPEGRAFIAHRLESTNYSELATEGLAVIYHELDLMVHGDCAVPENRTEGNSRITLPLGIVRRNGFTAGLSALLALNRISASTSDYHLDQQNMVYLSHKKTGAILTGIKSKHDPAFSTFRIGDDAYTVRAGELEMGDGWAEARLHYQAFEATIRWQIGDTAALTLSTNSDQTVTTSLPIADDRFIKTDHAYEIQELDGFSPYTAGNKSDKVKSLVFKWRGRAQIEFAV